MMMGQYSDVTNGAGETAPNNHEGWGRVDLRNALNATFIENESVSTLEIEDGVSIFQPQHQT